MQTTPHPFHPRHWIVNGIIIAGADTAQDAIALLEAARMQGPEPGPTAADVRMEASRRMQALVGARDAGHLDIVLSNASREAIRLLRKGDANWTAEEAARAAQLEGLDAAFEKIRAVSNVLEDMPPADYADNRHWT